MRRITVAAKATNRTVAAKSSGKAPRAAKTAEAAEPDDVDRTAPANAAPAKATPAKATPAKARGSKATAQEAARSSGAEPVRPPQAPAEGADGDEQAEVPMNRAERRAKGRGKSIAQIPGRGKVIGSPHGPAHTQRNWANRRTG
jgi:hypothetical protein